MLINRTIPGLYNGISQQPASMRLDTQGELQENGFSSVVHGLMKRAPTEFVATLDSFSTLDSFMHVINRDSSEQYIVIVTADPMNPIEIFKFDGTKCTVRYGTLDANLVFTPDDTVKNYITSGITNPRTQIKATTIADYTIIANTTKKPLMKNVIDNVQNPNIAVVYIKRGVAVTDYKVYVNDALKAEFTTGDTTAPATYKTNNIASNLYNSLVTNLGAGWTLSLIGSSISIEKTDQTDFNIRVEDSYGNQAMAVAKGSVQKFTDLPAQAPTNFIIEVTGDEGNSFDNYYVKYQNSDGVQYHAPVWVETTKPNLKNTFDETTLPHRLVRTNVNEFTFAPIIWEKRKVGDSISAPEPSFINLDANTDYTINDIFFFKNRLGFLTGENVVLSRAGDYFNFWPTTALDILDDDPIDISVATVQVAILRHAVPFNSTLLLFSDQQQFILSSKDNFLTPKTVATDPATQFDTSPICKPAGIGSNVYFVVPNGDYSSVREYFVQPDSLTNDATNISAHIPAYLPKNIDILVGSSAEDILLLQSKDEPKNVYVYKVYFSEKERLQFSWSKWIFDDDIINLVIMENYVFFLMKKDSQVTLQKMNLEKIATGTLPFRIHLDKLCNLSGVYDAINDKTTWTLPYTDSATTFRVIESSTGNQVLNVSKVNNTTLEAPGNINTPCYIGKDYVFRYRFSEWYIKSETDKVANIQGRLQIRTLKLSFTNTGYFALEITPFRRTKVIKPYTGVLVGVSLIGQPSLQSGEYNFLIMANTKGSQIDLVNDSYLPCEFQSASFEGFFVMRSRSA